MSLIDYAVLALLGAAAFFAIRRVAGRRGSGCCGDCTRCHGACPNRQEKK